MLLSIECRQYFIICTLFKAIEFNIQRINNMRAGSYTSNTINHNNELTQADKDKMAFQNTKKVVQERQELKRQYQRWVPQSINNQNALFSTIAPQHKPMKKQSKVMKISINIFDIPSQFKPCVKRTELSTRNSNLFTETQSQINWRSTSKKVLNQTPQQKEQTPKKMLRTSQNHNAKGSSIDLSWGTSSVQLQQNSKQSSRRSIYHKLNSSSIKF